MSIIYEALKKTQRSREIRNYIARENKYPLRFSERFNERTFNWFDLALGGVILVLLIVALSFYLPKLFRQHAIKPQPVVAVARPVVEEPILQTDLVLKGVLLSDQDKMALINNQPYHVGDTVEGLRIVSIEFNSVTLRKGNRKLVLRTAS